MNSFNNMFLNEDIKDDSTSPTKKNFLKKGIQSRKYDPQMAVIQEKEKKKLKEQ